MVPGVKELHDAYAAACETMNAAADAYIAAIRAELPPEWTVGPGQAWTDSAALTFDGDLWHATAYDGQRKIRGHAPTIKAALLALDACRAKKVDRTG